MKRYALTGLMLLLVGCSSDDADTTEIKEETIEKVEEVEVVKELTQAEKDDYDYDVGYKRLSDLELYFDMYMDTRESKSDLAFVKDKTMSLELAKLGVEMQEHLLDFEDLDTLYDKEYELKINEYSKLLSETIYNLTESNISNYKKYMEEIGVKEAMDTHEKYVLKHDEMMIVRSDVIDYHNNKYQ